MSEPCDGCANRATHFLCDTCINDDIARLNTEIAQLKARLGAEKAAFERGVKAMQKAAVALVDARASERRSTGNTYDDFIADSCDSIAHALRAMHPLPRDEG